jgi:hypothetical protein
MIFPPDFRKRLPQAQSRAGAGRDRGRSGEHPLDRTAARRIDIFPARRPAHQGVEQRLAERLVEGAAGADQRRGGVVVTADGLGGLGVRALGLPTSPPLTACQKIIQVLEKSPRYTMWHIMHSSLVPDQACPSLARELQREPPGNTARYGEPKGARENRGNAIIGQGLEGSMFCAGPCSLSQIAQIAGMSPPLDSNACRLVDGTPKSDSESSVTVRIRVGLHPMGETAKLSTADSSPFSPVALPAQSGLRRSSVAETAKTAQTQKIVKKQASDDGSPAPAQTAETGGNCNNRPANQAKTTTGNTGNSPEAALHRWPSCAAGALSGAPCAY